MNAFDYTDQDGTGLSDHQLHERYDEMLNEVYDDCTIGAGEYETARALREIDPIAYRCGFNDWLDSELTEGIIVEVSA